MARVSLIQTSLNGGILSPLLAGRPDIQKYGVSLRVCRNGLPLTQGPCKKRGGFRYLGATKDNDRVLLLDFVRSRKTAYVLEFGERYVRFWTERGQAVTDDGQPYEIESPYTLENLLDDAGRPRLNSVQSGDVLYLACPDLPPHKLLFKGVNDWVMEKFVARGGPWEEPNSDKALTIAVAGTRNGKVTLTASGPVFKPGHAGALLRLENTYLDDIYPWGPEQKFGHDYCHSDGKTYKRVSSRAGNCTGSVTPTHTRGQEWDGGGSKWLFGDVEAVQALGILWEYQDSGYGIVRITEVISETSAKGEVVKGYELPEHILTVDGSAHPTWLWQFGAWSDAGTYPSCCTFFRERLVFGGGTRVWMSKSADFENFEDKTFGESNTDNAVTVLVVTEQGVDTVAALASMQTLVVITGGGEVIISESATSEPFGPENVRMQPQSSYGGLALAPVKVGGSSLFVQAGGLKVREMSYSFADDSWTAPDLTVLADSAQLPGLLACAYQQEPHSIVWYVRGDGALVCLTRNRDQEVIAWHEHFAADGKGHFESLAAIPASASPDDELYAVIRLDAGEDDRRRFVCCLEEGLPRGGSLEDAFFLDCGKTVESVEPVSIVPSLEHLEGLMVDVLADGGTHEPCLVQNGQISLQFPARKIQVGLGYEFLIETMPIEAGAQAGTAQSARKLIRAPILRVFESVGGEVGQTKENRWQQIFSRDTRDAMDNPVSLVTGDVDAFWPGGWERSGCFAVRQRQPLPLCVLALIFVVESIDH